MLSWLFSGSSSAIPNLKIALSEGEIGWIPYFLERAEQVLDKQRHWVEARHDEFTATTRRAAAEADLDTPRHPRDRSATTSSAASSRTPPGSRSLDEIGEDNVMCETDYPHSDSTWPNCIDVAREAGRRTSPEVQYKILRGNAERLYRFTPAEPPASSTG